MLLRVLRATGDPATPALEDLVTTWSEDFATHFEARWIPLPTQVEHQTRTILSTYAHLP
jgi:hypothetical protein